MKLYICEKPSQARDLANNLNISGSNDGYIGDSNTVITWAIGHLIQQLEPDKINPKYKKWQLEHLPIIPNNWQMEPNPKTKKQLNTVGKLLKQTHNVIIATDGDREGETIGRELLDYFNYNGTIKRLWLTALDDSSIQKALTNLKTDNDTKPLYFAGLARSRADWLVGMSLTRLMTLLAQRQGYQGVLSIGRVQTPTLAIVVKRDLEIDNFIPKDYFNVIATFTGIVAKWQPNKELGLDKVDEQSRCINKQLAQSIINTITSDATAQVSKFNTVRKKIAPPLLFSLSALQQETSKKFSYGAKQTLDIAQKLYETHKLTTYPRTDCKHVPESQFTEAQDVCSALFKVDNNIQKALNNTNLKIKSRVWNDKKLSAHHAIIPTTNIIGINQLNEAEFNIYDLIRRSYISQFYTHYEYDKTDIAISVNNEVFTTTLNVDKIIGWKSALNDDYQSKTVNIPQLSVGQNLSVDNLDLQTKQTTPPSRYTEGTLIAAMEKAHLLVTDEQLKKVLKGNEGIGTEATRANIIQLLLNRKFVTTKNKKLISTDIGRTLVAAVPKEIKDPAMTAIWESSLAQIELGKLKLQSFMDWQEKWLHQFVANYKDKDIAINSANSTNKEIKTYPCPVCEKDMFLRASKKGKFWGCSGYPNCKTTATDSNGKPLFNSDLPDCPNCDKKLNRIKGKKGYFWACKGYFDNPKCEFTAQDKNNNPVLNKTN